MSPDGPVDLERRVREQEALLEIGLELAATLDLRRVLLARARPRRRSSAAPRRARSGSSTRRPASSSSASCAARAAPEIENLRDPARPGHRRRRRGRRRAPRRSTTSRATRAGAATPSEQFDTRAILAVPLTARGTRDRRAAAAQSGRQGRPSRTTTRAACSCSPARSRTRSTTPGSTPPSSGSSSRR